MQHIDVFGRIWQEIGQLQSDCRQLRDENKELKMELKRKDELIKSVEASLREEMKLERLNLQQLIANLQINSPSNQNTQQQQAVCETSTTNNGLMRTITNPHAEIYIIANEWQNWDERLRVQDGRTVTMRGNQWCTACAKNAFCLSNSRSMREVYYFEVKIVSRIGWIQIGLCDNKFSLNGKPVGSCPNSFAIRSDGNFCIEGQLLLGNMAFGDEHVVGCGLEVSALALGAVKRHLFFTRDGTLCGKPIPLTKTENGVALFPAVSLCYSTDEVKANFGQDEFKYNLKVQEPFDVDG